MKTIDLTFRTCSEETKEALVELYERLEGVEGADRRLVTPGEVRARLLELANQMEGHDAKQEYATTPPFPDQGGGGAQRLHEYWKMEEAGMLEKSQRRSESGLEKEAIFWKEQADGLAIRRAQLRAALVEEPPTQSEEGELEECPECGGVIIDDLGDGIQACWMCKHQWTRGKDRERSGSGNTQEKPPR